MPTVPPEQLCEKSSPPTKSRCPFMPSSEGVGAATKAYTVNFEPMPAKNFLRKAFTQAKELYAKVSPSSIRSAWYIGTQNDLSQPFLRSWKPGNFVSEFINPKGTVYVTANPVVMRAIFANSRKSADGIFYDHENKRLFVDGILKDLYPEDIQEIGPEKAADMLVLTAGTPHSANLRAPMIKALGSSTISARSSTLSVIADGILNDLTEDEKKECDVAQISLEYAATVISKLFTNYETTREGYLNLAKALDAFSMRMTRIVSHRPATVEQEKEYSAALAEMKAVIEGCLSSPSPYIQNLKDMGWNNFQLKANLFFLYFAGTETTASSMNYLIWQLGRKENCALQEEIRNSEIGQKILLKAIAESLRIHPPAFVEGRQLREDTLMTIKDKNNNIIWKKELLKGHTILCMTQAAGLDSNLYPNPEQFNPYRFQDEDSRITALSFYPFGSGLHTCPGQHLALAELQALISRILTHFSVRTLSPDHVEQKGFFTLRATPAKVQLTSRE